MSFWGSIWGTRKLHHQTRERYLSSEKCSSKAIKEEKMEESELSAEVKLKEELGLEETPDCQSD